MGPKELINDKLHSYNQWQTELNTMEKVMLRQDLCEALPRYTDNVRTHIVTLNYKT